MGILQRALLFTVTLLLGLGLTLEVQGEEGASQSSRVNAGEYTLSGPYTHKNLSLFLVHGKDRIKATNLLTLAEAMQKKLVVVHETGNVSQLTIENTSPAFSVYIQSGDIVKGGKQDRVIGFDLIIKPRSGKVPLASFCVEQGRWQKRGAESVAQFQSSGKQVASKELKLAAKYKSNQGDVWNKVAQMQKKLEDSVGTPVKARASESSLQLSLENSRVEASAAEYEKALSGVVARHPDVIGYAFAINGKMNSADVYGSGKLFRKLWPKLLNATAVEAVSEGRTGAATTEASIEDVQACMVTADRATPSARKKVSAKMEMVTQEEGGNVRFDTVDKEQNGEWIHRNYIKK